MIRIKLIAVGKLKEKYLVDGCDEYIKRLSGYCKLEVIVIDDEKIINNPSDAIIEQVKEKECAKILEKINDKDFVIVLDVNGVQKTSTELAFYIDNAITNGNSTIVFTICGSYGLNDNLRKRAQLLLSLSKATFTHQMTRLIILEQIYRSFKILNNETYHK